MAEPLIKSDDKPETKASGNTLLDSLVYMTGIFGHARSAESLTAGLAVDKNGMTPKLFCQAAERAGFRARVMKRALSDVPGEVLPAVAMLKSRNAVVILQRADKGMLRVLDPATRAEKS